MLFFFLRVSWCGHTAPLGQILQLFGMIFWAHVKPKSDYKFGRQIQDIAKNTPDLQFVWWAIKISTYVPIIYENQFSSQKFWSLLSMLIPPKPNKNTRPDCVYILVSFYRNRSCESARSGRSKIRPYYNIFAPFSQCLQVGRIHWIPWNSV